MEVLKIQTDKGILLLPVLESGTRVGSSSYYANSNTLLTNVFTLAGVNYNDGNTYRITLKNGNYITITTYFYSNRNRFEITLYLANGTWVASRNSYWASGSPDFGGSISSAFNTVPMLSWCIRTNGAYSQLYNIMFFANNISDTNYMKVSSTDNYIAYDYLITEGNTPASGNLLSFFDGAEVPEDPYANGGTSETGGGSGTFDGSSSNVGLPNTTPSAGAGASGFIKLFNPSAANLSALAAYLWGTFDISSFKSIYNNPIDCIITLMVIPVTPTTSTAATISLGNVATNVNAPVVSSQFIIHDCGSLNINEYWGAYLDYDPYTKCEIYLPYIGVHDIDINDIQGKTIQLKYYIDVLSGACVALLLCGTDVLYHWSGQCGAEVPITSTSFGSVFQTALSAANAIGETIVNAMSGIPQTVSLVASSVFNGARSKVHKSGSIGSMAGHMDIQKPYLIITRPVQSVPEKLNELQGYPSNITATLSDLEGYTEVETIYLKNIPATTAELEEIEALLKGGVII